MKKVKQILALIGVIFLIGLYLLTFLSSITDNPNSMNYFAASIVATVIIPVLLWAYSFIYRLLSGKGTQNMNKPSAEKTPTKPVNQASDNDFNAATGINSAMSSKDTPKETDSGA